MARHGWALVPDGAERRLYDLETLWGAELAAIGYRTGWTSKVIQEYLRDHGLYSGAQDGDLGPRTVTAIQELLKTTGVKLTADGDRGQVTAVAEYRLLSKGLPVPPKILAARKAAAAAKAKAEAAKAAAAAKAKAEAAAAAAAKKNETEVKESTVALPETLKYRDHSRNADRDVTPETYAYFMSLGQDKVLDLLEELVRLVRAQATAEPTNPPKE